MVQNQLSSDPVTNELTEIAQEILAKEFKQQSSQKINRKIVSQALAGKQKNAQSISPSRTLKLKAMTSTEVY